MLDYTAVEAGVQGEPDTSVELPGWKRSLVSWMETVSASMGVLIETEMTAGGAEYARFNAEQVRQLLQHLLRVAFTIEGVAKVRLGLRVQPVVTIPDGLLRLAFDVEARLPEGVSSIWPERGLRLDPINLRDGRTYDGASVSLAIAERLAEKLGAEVKVGASFHAPWRAVAVLTVPAVVTESAGLGQERRGAMSVMRAKLQEHSSRMAVIESDPRSRAEMIALVGEAAGAPPTGVEDAAGLARRVAEDDLSVVIACSNSPAVVAEIARSLESTDSAQVTPYLIVVSSDQAVRTVEGLLDAGADAYVPRPLNQAGLLIALSDAWLEYERRRERTSTG